MVKTTVYLDADTALNLRDLATRQQRPQAELIREALANYTRQFRRPMPKGIGKYSSGRPDIGSRAEEILRGAARERRWR